jgi:zinc and cadmium transporter
MTLFFIILTCIAMGSISFIFSYLFIKNSNQKVISNMVSLAVGTLLGTAFLEIIPHSIELSTNVHLVSVVILLGIFTLFILEKFFIWRHCHGSECEAHTHEQNTKHDNNGSLILIGNSFHNLIDGILIASAFLVNVNLGFVTALAIFAHELPQEISNISILVHSGFKKRTALSFNIISSMFTLFGAVLSFYVLEKLDFLIPYILSFSASTMIYIAVSDLIPDLHKKTQLNETLTQVLMISIGLLIIFIIHSYLH